ncbi:hypothetical protein M9458_056066 [Cirrhinus mrigala]|uniref:Uncharacterized protein n=1 Tax=Cirrhinus mrigala TaxID=683832 RepID=A0ABD0MIZ5_CIRMR
MIDRMLEQRTAINRVLDEDRKVNVSITWQDEDVLQSLNKALKPVKDTLAPSDDDSQLTANLKAGIMSILDEKYEALPEASQQLMRKTAFHSRHCDSKFDYSRKGGVGNLHPCSGIPHSRRAGSPGLVERQPNQKVSLRVRNKLRIRESVQHDGEHSEPHKIPS